MLTYREFDLNVILIWTWTYPVINARLFLQNTSETPDVCNINTSRGKAFTAGYFYWEQSAVTRAANSDMIFAALFWYYLLSPNPNYIDHKIISIAIFSADGFLVLEFWYK